MDGQNTTATLIRKLRKKLRQIENLQRTDRDLTDEEQNKVCAFIPILVVSVSQYLKIPFQS